MRLFKFESKKVRDLKKILKETLEYKNGCINRLKEEINFLKGNNSTFDFAIMFSILYQWSKKHVVSWYMDGGMIDSVLIKIQRDGISVSRRVESSDLKVCNDEFVPVVFDSMLEELESKHGYITRNRGLTI